MAQPPRKCAVIGTSKISPMLLPGKPSMCSATRVSASCAAGIHVGFGRPWPCLEVTFRRPSLVRLVNVVSELSCVCMTSPMMVRSDQRFRPPYSDSAWPG